MSLEDYTIEYLNRNIEIRIELPTNICKTTGKYMIDECSIIRFHTVPAYGALDEIRTLQQDTFAL